MSKKYKQKFEENVGYDADGQEHSTPTPTVGFDDLRLQLSVWNIDQCEFEGADTPEQKRELLLKKGVKPKEIEEFLDGLHLGKSSLARESSSALNAATEPKAAPHTDATGPESRWTLPEAMGHAWQALIANYLPHDASDAGYTALTLGKLLPSANRSLAETIAATIRSNPHSLLDAKGGGQLVAALVDLLEAAHFGTCANRFPGLLPTDNRKQAASTARKALGLLAKGSQGNPPDYPSELLASEVGLIQVALAPIKKTWGASNLKTVRNTFGDEVNHFSDKKLKSLLTDSLLTAAARLAEETTGISAESFETAWKKHRSIQKTFKDQMPQ